MRAIPSRRHVSTSLLVKRGWPMVSLLGFVRRAQTSLLQSALFNQYCMGDASGRAQRVRQPHCIILRVIDPEADPQAVAAAVGDEVFLQKFLDDFAGV